MPLRQRQKIVSPPLSTSAVTTVNSLLSHVLPFFGIGPKLRCIRSTPIASESMSENDFECFANMVVNSLRTPYSSARISDIYKPSGACCCPPSCASRLRNQFASQYRSRHRLSCGSGANNWTSPQLSGSPPNLPALSRRRNGKLYLFVPAEDVLAHKTFTAIGASVAPLVLLHLPQWQSDQELVVGQNQK